jgi:hypothetical protein
MSAGIHWQALTGSRWIAAVSGLVQFPTGDPGFTTGANGETLSVEGGYALSPAVEAKGELAYSNMSAGKPALLRLHSFIPSVELTDEFWPRAQLFVEGFGTTTYALGQGGVYGYDGGLKYNFGHVQVDVETGALFPTLVTFGGNHQHYVGAGASFEP